MTARERIESAFKRYESAACKLNTEGFVKDNKITPAYLELDQARKEFYKELRNQKIRQLWQ